MFNQDALFVQFARKGLCLVVDLLYGGFGSGFAALYGGDFFAEVDFGLALGKGSKFLFDEAFCIVAVDAVGSNDGGDLFFADLVGSDGGADGAVQGVERLCLFFQVIDAQGDFIDLSAAGDVLQRAFLGFGLQAEVFFGVFGKLFED